MLETSEENAFWTRHYASANEEKVTERKNGERKLKRRKSNHLHFCGKQMLTGRLVAFFVQQK
jgi:hypothetical protein